MRSRLIKLVVMGASLLLMATYILLNQQKLVTLSSNLADINSGKTSLEVRLSLAGEIVHQQALKDSDIFDAAGVRQIFFVHLPDSVFARVQSEMKAARLTIDQHEMTLTKTGNASAVLAVTADKRIYLLKEGEFKYILTVIWNQRLRSGKFVHCVPAELCASIKITSQFWGPVQGPYLGSDITTARRGMPKGRWVRGPRAVIDIQSGIKQKVWLQINLLSEFPDQQIGLRGATTPLQKVNENSEALKAGGRLFYPAVYVVPLNLQPGANSLEMAFSKWDESNDKNVNPLAAYITAIGLKQVP